MESWPLETRLSGRRYFMNRLCLLSRQSYFLPLVEDLLRIKSSKETPALGEQRSLIRYPFECGQ